jgi:hypothetical protein
MKGSDRPLVDLRYLVYGAGRLARCPSDPSRTTALGRQVSNWQIPFGLLSMRLRFFSVEGDGFEMNRPEAALASSKLGTGLRELVRRPRRKMHSPAPVESSSSRPLSSPE